jgi:hypothetical protein
MRVSAWGSLAVTEMERDGAHLGII